MTAHSVKHKRRVIGCFFFVVLLVFGTAFGFSLAKYIRDKRGTTADAEELSPPPPTYTAALTNIVRERLYPAIMQADKDITLSAAVDGEIVGLYVDVGSVVTQDEILVELDKRYKKIALKEADAALHYAIVTHSNAVIDLANNRNLYKTGVVGDDVHRQYIVAHQNSVALLHSSEAAYEFAGEQLIDCTVVAPCDGKISARFVELGERVNPKQPLLTVVDDTKLRLVFVVDDRDIVHLANGTKVTFSTYSFPDVVFTAIVTAVGADVEPETLLFRIEATYDNAVMTLKPGMVARVRVPIEEFRNIVVIPSYTVKYFKHGEFVSLYAGGSNRTVKVRLGKEYDDWVQVLDGVNPGDKVLLQ